MDLVIVLFSFGVLFFLITKVLIGSVNTFENRERYETKAVITEVEYNEKSDNTLYYVEFTDRDGNAKSGKSLNYQGKPTQVRGNLVTIDHLLRDEIRILIEMELVDVKDPLHKSMAEVLTPKLEKLYWVAKGFFLLATIALIYHFVS